MFSEKLRSRIMDPNEEELLVIKVGGINGWGHQFFICGGKAWDDIVNLYKVEKRYIFHTADGYEHEIDLREFVEQAEIVFSTEDGDQSVYNFLCEHEDSEVFDVLCNEFYDTWGIDTELRGGNVTKIINELNSRDVAYAPKTVGVNGVSGYIGDTLFYIKVDRNRNMVCYVNGEEHKMSFDNTAKLQEILSKIENPDQKAMNELHSGSNSNNDEEISDKLDAAFDEKK